MPVLLRNQSLWQGNGTVSGSKTLRHVSPLISGHLPQQAWFRKYSVGTEDQIWEALQNTVF